MSVLPLPPSPAQAGQEPRDAPRAPARDEGGRPPAAGDGFDAVLARRREGAEMFNEHGLFGRAVPAPTGSAPPRPPGAPASAPQSADSAATTADPFVRDRPASGDAARGGAMADADSGAALPPPALHRGTRGSAGQGEAVLPAAPRNIRSAAQRHEPAPAAHRTAARPVQAESRAPAGAAAGVAARLALLPGEGGLSLVARAQSTSAEEKLRLRSAIEALLQRSGLRVREIVINGEKGPPRGPGGE